jgi:hypothetical protein
MTRLKKPSVDWATVRYLLDNPASYTLEEGSTEGVELRLFFAGEEVHSRFVVTAERMQAVFVGEAWLRDNDPHRLSMGEFLRRPGRNPHLGLDMPFNETPDDVFRRCAIAARLLQPGEALTDQLREFALLIVTECAEIGDGYGDKGSNAGAQIRAEFFPDPRET